MTSPNATELNADFISTSAGDSQRPPTPQAPKLGGWLFLPAIALVVAPISFVRELLPLFAPKRGHLTPHLIMHNFIADVVIVLLVGIVAWFFFRKKSAAPGVFVAWILSSFLIWNYLSAVTSSANVPFGSLFMSLVFIPYFAVSKRVQRTFVSPLSASPVDRVLSPVAGLGDALGRLLRRLRWWSIPSAILFLIVNIIAGCAVRSVVLYGDVSHTIELLL